MALNRERAAYFRNMEPVMRHNLQLSINSGRYRSAADLAQRLVDFHPDRRICFGWLKLTALLGHERHSLPSRS